MNEKLTPEQLHEILLRRIGYFDGIDEVVDEILTANTEPEDENQIAQRKIEEFRQAGIDMLNPYTDYELGDFENWLQEDK